MSKSRPTISVGMPVYNGEPYLEEAIQSILSQTYEDFELIISDNASTDRTELICRDYASQDKRISYSRNAENLGAAKNYNRVFQLASGHYFRWFNADDVSAPELHERCIQVMDANADAALCYGKTAIIDGKSKVTEQYDDNLDLQQERAVDRYIAFFDSLGFTNVIYGLMRTSMMANTMLFGNGRYPAADIAFMAELTLYGKFIEIPEQLFFRRMHEKASSWERKNLAVQQKFWQGKQDAWTLGRWKLHFAFLSGIRSAPIGSLDKVKLYKYILRVMVRRRKRLLNELTEEVFGRVLKSKRINS
jgi:glycosyltransferase involved in cell wall biosynthesis